MGATGKKKKAAEKKTQKKASGVRKVNPFELKFNKSKHDILGRKKNTAGVGHPGLSKKRAYEQREKTLGIEHERIGIVNKIVDKRIGEKDEGKTAEEKASLRFTAERMKNFKKANKFNLVDDDEEEVDESLTHGGKALTSVQKYERTLGSDDEEEGNLGADIVKMAHFGGGDFERPGVEKASRKDVIADLISRSKQIRHEKQAAKDDQEQVTEDLDAKYLKLLGKVQTGFRVGGAAGREKEKKDDFDKLALAMKIDADARATPAERTKSEDEKAAEDRERLEEMERLRLARMNAQSNKRGHLSADMDVTGQVVNPKKKAKAERFEVRFDEQGNMIEREKVEKSTIRKVAIDSDDALTDEDEEEDENDEDLDDMLESGEEEEGAEREAEKDSDEEEEDEEMDEEEESADDESEEEEMEEDDVIVPERKKKGEKKRKGKEEGEKKEGKKEKVPLPEVDTSIPFVFEMPKKYPEFCQLVGKYAAKDVGIVIERLVKCHHPSLKEGNKKLMSKLFLFLLRFYDETARSSSIEGEVVTRLGQLTKAMYRVMKFDIEYGVRCVRALIRQNWKEREGKGKRAPASFALISLLRLVAALYPVSDVWHPVCSPTLLLATCKLAECHVTSLTVVAREVLLATTIGDYVEESKRFVPEVLAFLRGCLLLAVENREGERPPTNAFPLSMPHKQMMLVEEPLPADAVVSPLKLSEVFDSSSEDVDSLEDTPLNRCRVLRALIGIIQKFRLIYAVHEHSYTAIFTPFVSLLKRLPLSLFPTSLSEEVEALTKSMEAECKSRSRLTQLSQVKTEKSMLKMLEPCIEENFDPERPRMSRDANRQGSMAEKKKMQHLYKKEMRGAIKELRKDTAFLSRKQRKETMEKDKDRQMKTKRLMQGLQSQQGEWNKEQFENGKKKKKK